MLEYTVVVRSDGGMRAVAGPVRTGLGLRVDSTWVAVVLCHVSRGAVRARLRVVLSWALRRDRGVYGYIRVRLELLGIFMGFLMGRIGTILKIQ